MFSFSFILQINNKQLLQLSFSHQPFILFGCCNKRKEEVLAVWFQ